MNIFLRFSPTFTIILCNIFICVEELNYMRNYMKVRLWSQSNYAQNWFYSKSFLWLFWKFLKLLAEHLWWNYLNVKYQEKFLHFENSTMCIGSFQKIALLEILRNFLFTRVVCLQSRGYNTTKNRLLTKFFKVALKISENSQKKVCISSPFS